MTNLNSIPPVKTSVSQRSRALLTQHQKVRQEQAALVVDPLMPLRQAVPMLGSPSYSLLRKWIRDGSLRCWRAGTGQYRVRLSEVRRFIDSGFPGGSDAR
jgi:excisionase family DNA binding protein